MFANLTNTTDILTELGVDEGDNDPQVRAMKMTARAIITNNEKLASIGDTNHATAHELRGAITAYTDAISHMAAAYKASK